MTYLYNDNEPRWRHVYNLHASSGFSQEIYKDRKKFSKAVFEVASSDLVNMGISVVSYTLKDIRDEEVSRPCERSSCGHYDV